MNVQKEITLRCENFTDWHIDLDKTVDQSVAFPGQIKVHGDMIPYAEALADLVAKGAIDSDRFIIHHNNYRYRVNHACENIYALRKIGDIPSFSNLNIPHSIQSLLLNENLHRSGGLILISGPAGSGKTTTATAMIRESLIRNGGYCLTLEAPPEYSMQGFHGEHGYCNQVDVTKSDWAKEMALSLGKFPSKTNSILFVGEVTTADGAKALLQNAISGHLVVATVHGNDLQESILRLLALARSGGEREAKYLLSASLKLVVNQSIADGKIKMRALEVDRTVSSIIQNSRDLNLVDCIRRTEKKIEAMEK